MADVAFAFDLRSPAQRIRTTVKQKASHNNDIDEDAMRRRAYVRGHLSTAGVSKRHIRGGSKSLHD